MAGRKRVGEYGTTAGNILIGLALVVIGGILLRRARAGAFRMTLGEDGRLLPVTPYGRATLALVMAAAVAAVAGVAMVLAGR